MMELKSSFFSYYQRLSKAYLVKGYNRMNGEICSVNEDDSIMKGSRKVR